MLLILNYEVESIVVDEGHPQVPRKCADSGGGLAGEGSTRRPPQDCPEQARQEGTAQESQPLAAQNAHAAH